MSGFCRECADWRFESNPALQTDDERDGFGVCERIEQMKANPIRAVARIDDELAQFLTRDEFGCALFTAK